MRIAVVGSGISGLVAAWELERLGKHVTVFERHHRVGFDGHAVDVELAGKSYRFDVPLRLLNAAQWPTLTGIYSQIGIETVEVEATQTFCDEYQNVYLRINNSDLFSVKPLQWIHRTPQRIIADLLRFRRQGSNDLNKRIEPGLTFRQYLQNGGYSSEFVSKFLYPLLSSTVCTCSFTALDQYPAEIILRSLQSISQADDLSSSYLRRSKFGSTDVSNKLTSRMSDVRVQQTVESVQTTNGGVLVGSLSPEGQPDSARFDHVVMALQANHAIDVCRDLDPVLSSVCYEPVEVCVHRDRRLMPASDRDWSTFNFLAKDRVACCTISMNKFYGDGTMPEDLFQTINPIFAPDEKLVVSRVYLQRPTVTVRSRAIWQRIQQMHKEDSRRVWVTGSYAAAGIPLLESGVIASQSVANSIRSQAEDLLAKEC